MLFNFELALTDVVLGKTAHPTIINAVAISISLIIIMESVHPAALEMQF